MQQKQKQNKMVTLYLARTVDVSCERLDMVTEERRQRIQRCKDSESQKQILTAGLLLDKVFSLYGIDRATLRKGPCGKPMVEGIHFNLSHTDGLVICAVSNSPIGCDVERIKRAPEGVAERFFHPNEKMYLEQCHEDYDKDFFRLWTMKESYLKMTGEGMHLPMKDFEVCIGAGNVVLRNGEKQSCFIKEYNVSGYQISTCAEEEFFSDLVWVRNETSK